MLCFQDDILISKLFLSQTLKKCGIWAHKRAYLIKIWALSHLPYSIPKAFDT